MFVTSLFFFRFRLNKKIVWSFYERTDLGWKQCGRSVYQPVHVSGTQRGPRGYLRTRATRVRETGTCETFYELRKDSWNPDPVLCACRSLAHTLIYKYKHTHLYSYTNCINPMPDCSIHMWDPQSSELTTVSTSDRQQNSRNDMSEVKVQRLGGVAFTSWTGFGFN